MRVSVVQGAKGFTHREAKLKPFATTETVQLVQDAAGISLVSSNEHNTLRHRAIDR